jgi:lysyl-tRNA synthetase class 2
VEVNTPILASDVGGAIAQPFQTSAAEFPERQLSLRIAPELWLKRLVVGGFDKVFEIGPSFRNEGRLAPKYSVLCPMDAKLCLGLDRTHNPEFTTCEFYHAFADLKMLMSMTESFFSGLEDHVRDLSQRLYLSNPADISFATPFRQIDFIPALEESVGQTLPDLASGDAHTRLLQLFRDLSLPIPDHPTLPRLLDKLCAIYLEPQCQNPTFIINHPECLSPLSKSYPHGKQIVAARAELFVRGNEIVNTYEEENSPFEQRRKFQDQLLYRDPNNLGEIDESYIQALEWGLPPTGGWGCGIDRLCMLFTGARRIGDVLSFGNLRSVTGSRYRVENDFQS